MYVAKCEKDNEPLKIRTDIRQGGSFLCAITAPIKNACVCDTYLIIILVASGVF